MVPLRLTYSASIRNGLRHQVRGMCRLFVRLDVVLALRRCLVGGAIEGSAGNRAGPSKASVEPGSVAPSANSGAVPVA